MTRAKRYSRFALVTLGCLLVAAGSAAGYWWHYKLAPLRHLADPVWLAAHSEAARWEEEQNNYRRLGSSPDLCFRGDRIGFYGDKQWFLWLDERIRSPERFRHCGCTEYALALMTNHHVDSWAQWTDAHRGSSQEEWIRDGFLAYGVTVHFPPTPDDTVPLLRLLGRKTWNTLRGGKQGTNAPETVPSYVQYNAYRWLRDSGFDPVRFASSSGAAAGAESDLTAGLLGYSRWSSAYPRKAGLGVLAFGKADTSRFGGRPLPPISKPWMLLGVEAFIAACIVGGAALVWRFTRYRVTARSPM